MRVLTGDDRVVFEKSGWGEVIFCGEFVQPTEATISEVAMRGIGLYGGEDGNHAFDGLTAKFGNRKIRFWHECNSNTVINTFCIECEYKETAAILRGFEAFEGAAAYRGVSAIPGYHTFETA